MPEPISAASSNMSVYDPNAQMSVAPAESELSLAPPIADVTIQPVFIEGDAGPRRLVAEYDRGQPAACLKERGAAVFGCSAAAATVGAGLLAAPTGVGGVMVGLSAWVAVGNCHRLVSEYDSCKERGAAQEQAVGRCEVLGGVPLVSEDQVTCLVIKP